jgi:Asp-tRNA(Asn)/Glu-tRNA(Gln) amidotransferase A subunit family amidase
MTATEPRVNDDLFLDLPIGSILEKLQAREITPSAMADVCLQRSAELGDKYKVWVAFDEERLRAQARAAESRIAAGEPPRALEGIPIGVKDIFNTADLPTQMGSPLWKDFTPGNDARVVYYLRNAGAVIPGKTDTAEFAVHAIGNCLNPHDPSRTPGTSSSGSAVAVALGIVPAAIGTQTAGSIVRPASFCGVYGCKPSFGLLPRTGMLKTTDSLDTIGFFCSMYEDLERMFDVLRVRGWNYPLSHAALIDGDRQNAPSGRPWRVAFARTHTWGDAPGYARTSIENFVGDLGSSGGVEIIEAKLPHDMELSHSVHQTIYDKSLSYYFQEEFQSREQISPIMNEIIERGKRITVDEYHHALEMQESLAVAMDEIFGDCDILVSLSTAGEAPHRDEVEMPDPALMWTLTYLPVISAPVFTSPQGLPFGVQVAARRYNDLQLFRFADHLRSAGLIPTGVHPRLD